MSKRMSTFKRRKNKGGSPVAIKYGIAWWNPMGQRVSEKQAEMARLIREDLNFSEAERIRDEEAKKEVGSGSSE